jgi:flagellar biosynthesis protein FliQ
MDPELRRLRDRVEADVARERGPVALLRALPRLWRFALFALIVGVIVALVRMWVPRADLALVPAPRLWAIVAIYGLVAAAAAWHALRPIWLPRASPWITRAIVAVALLAPFATALLPELTTHHAPAASSCFLNGGLLGLSVLLFARALDRGGHRGTDEALLGAAGAGLAGVMTLHMECPINFTHHLLVAHAPVPVVLLAIYGLLRRT